MIRPLSRRSTALSAAARSKLGIAALVAALAAACIPLRADAPNAAQAPASANMSPGEIGADRIKTTAAAPSAASAPPPVLPSVTPPVAEAAAAKDEKAKPKGPPPDGAPLPQTGPPAVGETVFVSRQDAWFPASVTAATAAGVKVKLASGGEEEVPADRVLREPATTKGLHYQPGQLVLVEYKGGLVEFIGIWLPAKVLKLVGKDYKVRFEEGKGPEGDQIVLSKRLRPR
jgi:hypothetical protein